MKRTPSGGIPVYLPKSLYEKAEALGWDMRWYDIVRPIPIKETS